MWNRLRPRRTEAAVAPERQTENPHCHYERVLTSNVIHFGTNHGGALVKRLNELAPLVRVFRDGDTWEDWGERLGEVQEPEHIMVSGLKITDAYRLTADVASLLVPMELPHQAGIIMSITDIHDWSLEVAHLKFFKG